MRVKGFRRQPRQFHIGSMARFGARFDTGVFSFAVTPTRAMSYQTGCSCVSAALHKRGRALPTDFISA
jgi:hypothetical protein